MRDEKLIHPKQTTLITDTLSKEKRYELIAQAAMELTARKNYRKDEQLEIWSTNDTQVDFGKVVKLCG